MILRQLNLTRAFLNLLKVLGNNLTALLGNYLGASVAKRTNVTAAHTEKYRADINITRALCISERITNATRGIIHVDDFPFANTARWSHCHT